MSPASALAHLPCCHPAQCWVGPKDSVTMRPHPASGAWMCFPILEDILGLRNYLEKPEQETDNVPIRGSSVQELQNSKKIVYYQDHTGLGSKTAGSWFLKVRLNLENCIWLNTSGRFLLLVKCTHPKRGGRIMAQKAHGAHQGLCTALDIKVQQALQ